MKFLKYFLLLTIIFTACKSTKNMIHTTAITKDYSAKKVIKKHLAVTFNKKTLDAKLKVNFDNGKTNQNLTVSLLLVKDQVIYIRGTKLITVFKAKITPDSVSYYSPYAKNYFTGDFSMIKELLGVEINFEQLQNLFLGQALHNLKVEKQTIEIVNNRYVLAPEKQASLYDIFFTIHPSHFKIDSQTIVNKENKLTLEIGYPSYKLIDEVIFPTAIHIKSTSNNKVTDINMTYKSVSFDGKVEMNFSVPTHYKRLEF